MRCLVRRQMPLLLRALPVLVLATAIVGVPVLVLAPTGLPRLRGLERELSGVQEENKALASTNVELERENKFFIETLQVRSFFNQKKKKQKKNKRKKTSNKRKRSSSDSG